MKSLFTKGMQLFSPKEVPMQNCTDWCKMFEHTLQAKTMLGLGLDNVVVGVVEHRVLGGDVAAHVEGEGRPE